MIDTVVFDMGQVLIRWTGQLMLERYGLSDGDNALLLRELFGEVEWVALDHGMMQPEEVAEIVCHRVPEHLYSVVKEVTTRWWEDSLFPVPGVAELLRELKANGYGIYLLSNAGTALRTYFPRIPGSECFDGLMVSAEEKLIKPDPAIFRTLLARFSLTAENCFFVDDSPANVESALCVGMQGCVFRGDVLQLRKKLKAAGVRCCLE